ncbi:MAG: sulfotransferase [Terriglobales bacterium]
MASATQVDTVLYILSPSYSGSTLLTFLLARHPEIATVGELKAATVGADTEYRCSCGVLLHACSFWEGIANAMHARGGEFSIVNFGTHFRASGVLFRCIINAGVRGGAWPVLSDSIICRVPSYRRALADIVRQNVLMMEAICQLQRGRIFLDASKDPERLRVLRQHCGKRIKAIRLLRDGRAVAHSYMKHYRVSMAVAGREVARTMAACDRVMDGIASGDKLTLRYEELCSDPETALQRIYSLASLEPVAEGGRRSPPDLHILGNVMRLGNTNSIRLDEKWRSELSNKDLDSFQQIAGQLNSGYGYTQGARTAGAE